MLTQTAVALAAVSYDPKACVLFDSESAVVLARAVPSGEEEVREKEQYVCALLDSIGNIAAQMESKQALLFRDTFGRSGGTERILNILRLENVSNALLGNASLALAGLTVENKVSVAAPCIYCLYEELFTPDHMPLSPIICTAFSQTTTHTPTLSSFTHT